MERQLSIRGRSGLALATFLCLAIGGYGVALAASGFRLLPDEVAANHLPLALRAHITSAAAALLLVPWQLWPGIRSRVPRLHRWTGRAYVVAATAGGLTGLVAAFSTDNGAVAGAGFAVLGALWTGATLAAYRAARRRDLVTHRRWAIRSFALAFAAVTLRLYLPLAAVAGFSFAEAYPLVAWLCWVPNLVIAERALRRSSPRAQPQAAAVTV